MFIYRVRYSFFEFAKTIHDSIYFTFESFLVGVHITFYLFLASRQLILVSTRVRFEFLMVHSQLVLAVADVLFEFL